MRQTHGVLMSGALAIALAAVATFAWAQPVELDLGEVLVNYAGTGAGIDPRTGQFVPAAVFAGRGSSAPTFVATDGRAGTAWLPWVDGVLVPSGVSTVDSTGGSFPFPDTEETSYDAARSGVAVFDEYDEIPIQLADQPGVNRHGIGLHANAGVTFDLDAIRAAFPGYSTDRFAGVAGINYDSLNRPAVTDIWILVDGAQQYFRTFESAGISWQSFEIPLANDARFLTVVTTDSNGTGHFDHTVIADATLTLEPTPPVFDDGFEVGTTMTWSATVLDRADEFDDFIANRGIDGIYVTCEYNPVSRLYSYLGQTFSELDGGIGGTPIESLEDLYWKNEYLASAVPLYHNDDADGDGTANWADADAFDVTVQ